MKKFYAFSLMILGMLVIFSGVALMLNPETSLQAFTLTIAILLILNGVNELIIYFQTKKYWHVTKWGLFEGILSLLFGIFTVSNLEIAEQIFVIMFAIWLFASAILHITAAFVIRPIGGWILLLIMGIVTTGIATLSLYTATVAAITIAIVLGLSFISLGITWIVMGWLSLKYLF